MCKKIIHDDLIDAASRLHNYINQQHWNGQSVTGADPGVRFNSRIGRFIKSSFNFLPWSDDLTYQQAQGYWIMSNWLMADIFEHSKYEEIALACSNFVLDSQRPGGHWDYPNREWKGRIATVEGCFATLGLLESYARSKQESYLDGADKWYHFLIDEIGFVKDKSFLAANYFAEPGSMVTNISAMVLHALAKFANLTGKNHYLSKCDAMVAWIKHVQMENGELPYVVEKTHGIKGDRRHFLCFQYNAFEFLDLLAYYHFTKDQAILNVLKKLANYLSIGVSDTGSAFYNCQKQNPEVTYYTAVVATALSQAEALGLADYNHLAGHAIKRVLFLQQADGNFQFYSQKNYILFSDRRSYPRYLSMILYHLLLEIQKQILKEEH